MVLLVLFGNGHPVGPWKVFPSKVTKATANTTYSNLILPNKAAIIK